MFSRSVHCRRARRTDFAAIVEVFAAAGAAAPVPDRATLRRFRRIVSDLGSDLYVAVIDGRIAGLVHLTYARQIATPPKGRIETLIVARDWRRRGVGSVLLALARERAVRRGCGELLGRADSAEAAAFLDRFGRPCAASEFLVDLPKSAGDNAAIEDGEP